MAKTIRGLFPLSGTLAGLTFVQSAAYGNHVRRARGTVKPARINDVLHQDTLPQEVMRQGLLAHTTVVINETLSRINPHYLRSKQQLAESNIKTSELDELIATLCALEDSES